MLKVHMGRERAGITLALHSFQTFKKVKTLQVTFTSGLYAVINLNDKPLFSKCRMQGHKNPDS